MAATCHTITRLCRKGESATGHCNLASHHHRTGRAAKSFGMERAGYGRNSKVLQAWTRGQMNLAPISEDNNYVLAVLCGKCSNGKEFAPFAVRLNHDTMLYEVAPDVDMEAWRADVAGTKSIGPLNATLAGPELCRVEGSDKPALSRAIIDDCACSRATSYRHITKAERSKR